MNNRKISVNEYDGQDGEQYVLISSGCCLPNYFRLRGVLKTDPAATADGTWANVNVLDGSTSIAKDVRMISIDGTTAHTVFKGMKKGDKFNFWAITRLDLHTVLDAADSGGSDDMKIPFEFVRLGVE